MIKVLQKKKTDKATDNVMKTAQTKKQKREKVVNNKKKGISLFGFVVIIGLIPLLISLLIFSIVAITVIRNNLESSEENTLRVAAQNLQSYCEDNGVAAMNASDYYNYIDGLKDSGIELAIIAPGIPCTTSIKNENDFRIREISLGIDLTADHALYANGYYDKHVEANEQSYYAYYMPVVQNGEEVAVAFAGQLKSSVVGTMNQLVTLFVCITFVLFAVSVLLVLLCSTRLSAVIKKVCERIKALSKGDLSKHSSFRCNVREVSEIVDAYDLTQERLADIIGGVKNGAEELVGSVQDVTGSSHTGAEQAELINESVEQLSASSTAIEENVVKIYRQMQEIGSSVNEINGSAEEYYKKGIRASMEFIAQYTPAGETYNHGKEITAEYIDQYLAQPNVQLKSNFDDALEQIITQKYLGSYRQSLDYECWFDHRRTGYPAWELNPSTNLNDEQNKFPIRWRYSQDEIDYNKANLEEALNRQYNGNDGFNEKMWIVPNAVETPIAGKIITDFGK